MSELNLKLFDCQTLIMVKCTLFIANSSVDKYFNFKPNLIYEDMFYDKINVPSSAEYGTNDTFFRRRIDTATGQVVEQVKQEKKPLSPNCHIYEQTEISDKHWPFISDDCFLSFVFERYNLTIPKGGTSYEHINMCTLDKVTSLGVNYCVLSLSCVFEKGMEWDDIRSTAQLEMISFLRKFSLPHYPVYTKFMYMLRLSRNFELFDDVFKKSCADVDARIEELVDRFVGSDKPRQNKEYVWVTHHVLELFEHCIGVGMDVELAIQYLNKKRKDVVDNDSVSFRHTYVY